MIAPDYADFLASKEPKVIASGIAESPSLPSALKSFQRDITSWALRRGRAAIFAGTGLGKTAMQLSWARVVADHSGGRVLILTPLAVAQQSVAEAAKFGIYGVAYAADQDKITTDIVVTNYDRLDRFDPSVFSGVVLDESSIIKSHDSKTRAALISAFNTTPWKLCCTATPAPNDYVELGNHAEFLGVMTEKEMLARFFVHDGKVRAAGAEGMDGWRLKRHAKRDFWRWLSSWAVVVGDPNEIGYDEPEYRLPPLVHRQITVKVPYVSQDGSLFPMEARALSERLRARRSSLPERVAAAAQIVNSQKDRSWLVWCHLNAEGEALRRAIPGAVEVAGYEDRDSKAEKLLAFARGEIPILISKPSLAGFGMNFQVCADMVFVGLNDSFEQLFQAKRRCWRFGQKRPVTVYMIASELEGAVLANLERKETKFSAMTAAMTEHTRDLVRGQIRSEPTTRGSENAAQTMEVPVWLQ